jgi:hypothetical protein
VERDAIPGVKRFALNVTIKEFRRTTTVDKKGTERVECVSLTDDHLVQIAAALGTVACTPAEYDGDDATFGHFDYTMFVEVRMVRDTVAWATVTNDEGQKEAVFLHQNKGCSWYDLPEVLRLHVSINDDKAKEMGEPETQSQHWRLTKTTTHESLTKLLDKLFESISAMEDQ